jgi:hypothetical protein
VTDLTNMGQYTIRIRTRGAILERQVPSITSRAVKEAIAKFRTNIEKIRARKKNEIQT